ncbi:MAG: DUF1064 domain-containing protein [Clostridia bacterium]|nr:DUF1064 domain-containing protein [Clostridia bacterium]
MQKKYGNKKVVVDGIQFDSKKEAQRYCELKLLQRTGKISNLQLQKSFELIPAQYETFQRFGKNGQKLKDGKRCIEKACVYRADFSYMQDGQEVVEDTKGYRDPSSAGYAKFVIKRKLLLWQYGIRIKEI